MFQLKEKKQNMILYFVDFWYLIAPWKMIQEELSMN